MAPWKCATNWELGVSFICHDDVAPWMSDDILRSLHDISFSSHDNFIFPREVFILFATTSYVSATSWFCFATISSFFMTNLFFFTTVCCLFVTPSSFLTSCPDPATVCLRPEVTLLSRWPSLGLQQVALTCFWNFLDEIFPMASDRLHVVGGYKHSCRFPILHHLFEI